jgi:hypothetical protein
VGLRRVLRERIYPVGYITRRTRTAQAAAHRATPHGHGRSGRYVERRLPPLEFSAHASTGPHSRQQRGGHPRGARRIARGHERGRSNEADPPRYGGVRVARGARLPGGCVAHPRHAPGRREMVPRSLPGRGVNGERLRVWGRARHPLPDQPTARAVGETGHGHRPREPTTLRLGPACRTFARSATGASCQPGHRRLGPFQNDQRHARPPCR